jgi:hypothetical protein
MKMTEIDILNLTLESDEHAKRVIDLIGVDKAFTDVDGVKYVSTELMAMVVSTMASASQITQDHEVTSVKFSYLLGSIIAQANKSSLMERLMTVGF